MNATDGEALAAEPIERPRPRRRALRILLVTVLALVAIPLVALGVFLIAVPPPAAEFAPESWEPGDGVPLAPDAMSSVVAEPLSDQSINGPEDVATDAVGRIYTGDRDGVIWRSSSDGASLERWVEVGGRPLGLVFAPDGRLLVANHGLGLQAITPDGRVETLVDEVAGDPVLFANDLDVSADGVVYLSDSSFRYNTTTLGTESASYLLPDALDGRAAGRLLSHDLASGASEVLVDGLYFPNGVALTADESALWVAESNRYRILEYRIGGDRARTLLADLPGTPDNIDRDADGRMLIAIYARTAVLDDFVLPFDLARQILIRLPTSLFVNEDDPLSGSILVADDAGNVDRVLTGLTPAATSVHPDGDRWLLGALLGQPIRSMDAP